MRFTHGIMKHTPEATVTWAISCGNKTAFITQEHEIIDKLNYKDVILLFRPRQQSLGTADSCTLHFAWVFFSSSFLKYFPRLWDSPVLHSLNSWLCSILVLPCFTDFITGARFRSWQSCQLRGLRGRDLVAQGGKLVVFCKYSVKRCLTKNRLVLLSARCSSRSEGALFRDVNNIGAFVMENLCGVQIFFLFWTKLSAI